MYSKSLKNIKLQNESVEISNKSDDCIVSKASTAIMLDRFCNGKEIDFPFSK